MTEDQATTLESHLTELRGKALERLAALAEDGATDMGMVAMVANIQIALEVLREHGHAE